MLQDSVIATALVMFISVAVIFLVVGGDQIDWMRTGDGGFSQSTYKNNIVFLLWIALTLTANIVVLLYGVRMFVGEIMMSFKGISERILPGAVAGVDCAAIFGFAPKSVVLGLLFGAIGQIIGLILLLVFKSPIFLIPGFIPLFFDNATVAIFANKGGGWKAAAILVTLNGIIQILGSALAVNMMQLTWWQGSADYATVWVVIIAIFKGIGGLLGIPVAG
jgi:PTS system ascorbate-specific IIC component